MSGRRLQFHALAAPGERWHTRAGVYLAVTLACATAGAAGELQELSITEHNGVYQVRVAMRLEAPAEQIFEVLTDYAHLYRLDSAITESLILPPAPDGAVRVQTRLEDCVLFVCLEVRRVERLHRLGPGELVADIEPELSDFRSGHAHWRVRPQEHSAVVVYEGSMEPAFKLPPIIGPAVMKRKLRTQTLNTLGRIECIARIRAQVATGEPIDPTRETERCIR